MGFIKKMIVVSITLATLVGVLARVLNYKRMTGNMLKKVLWFILLKSVQNTIELNKIKVRCFFQRYWGGMHIEMGSFNSFTFFLEKIVNLYKNISFIFCKCKKIKAINRCCV